MQKLQEMELDAVLVVVLRRQSLLLLDSGPTSGLGSGIHPESIPMHTYAKFLFLALLPHDTDLAYRIGLRAMRLPILEDHEDIDDPVNGNVSSLVLSRYPRWFTLGHIEAQQGALASTMLSAAKGEYPRRFSIEIGGIMVVFVFVRRRHQPAADGARVLSAEHPQLFALVQTGSGRLPIRHAPGRTASPHSLERRLRARSSGKVSTLR